MARDAGIGHLGGNLALPLIRQNTAVHAFPECALQARGIYAGYPTKKFASTKLKSFLEHLEKK